MARKLLKKCRDEIANESPVGPHTENLIAEIDAALAEPEVAEGERTAGEWECGQHPATSSGWIVKPVLFGSRAFALPECEGGHIVIRSERDAHLIAAAPDMLAALEAAQAELSSLREFYGEGLEVHGWHLNGAPEPLDTFFDDNDHGAIGKIEAAIAKAKGGAA